MSIFVSRSIITESETETYQVFLCCELEVLWNDRADIWGIWRSGWFEHRANWMRRTLFFSFEPSRDDDSSSTSLWQFDGHLAEHQVPAKKSDLNPWAKQGTGRPHSNRALHMPALSQSTYSTALIRSQAKWYTHVISITTRTCTHD